MITDILKVNEAERNFSWDEKFFKSFTSVEVRMLSQEPQQGPDGWPYIICETLNVKNDGDFEVESTQRLFQWLATRGIGLIVNPRREPYPDYVFSYGMIWSFRETGFFMRPDLAQSNSGEVNYSTTKLFSGAPTEEFLPLYVRKVLKDFFRDQTVLAPKVLMISTDQVKYDLCFSLESLGSPPTTEHEGIAEAIAWFLPPHYSIVLISEKNLPTFHSL